MTTIDNSTVTPEVIAPVAAPGPAGAPAATPATPAKTFQLGTPEAEAPVTPRPGTETAFQYDPTGDAGLDYALGFVGKLGYSDAHPAIIAAQAGDFNLLRVELATKNVPGAEAVVKLAEDAYIKHTKAGAEASQAITDYAHGLSGGAENWGTIAAWASANADADEKADLNEALAKGGAAARRALNYIVDGYKKSNTLKQEPSNPVKAGAETSVGTANGPLTAKDYSAAVLELQRAAKGRDISNSPAYLNLQSQRLAARRQGVA